MYPLKVQKSHYEEIYTSRGVKAFRVRMLFIPDYCILKGRLFT